MTSGSSVHVKDCCSVCRHKDLKVVIDLGFSPIANKFLYSASDKYEKYPLVLQHCGRCKNLQLQTCLSEALLYDETYAYFTPSSASLDRHYAALEQAFRKRKMLSKDARIIEIGSNNGEFLKPYLLKGFSVLGVDPAKNAVQSAACIGVPSICSFFDERVAEDVKHQFGTATIVVARHMFAHNSEPRELIKGVAEVLSDDGIFYIENAYAIDTLINGEFDQVYHEHMFYYGALSLNNLLNSMDFELFDIVFSPIHGGSAGFFAARRGMRQETDELRQCFERERSFFSADPSFSDFRSKVDDIRKELTSFVNDCVEDEIHVGVYSVPNKFFTLLSVCAIDPKIFSIIVDTSPNKLDKFLPGSRVPILAEGSLLNSQCKTYIIGAWNYKEDIKSRASQIFPAGTRLVFPLPHFEIYEV